MILVDANPALLTRARDVLEAARGGAEVIDVQGCELTHLPDCFGDFPNLRKVILSGNHLRMLPASLLQHKKVTTLYCDNNQLRDS